MRGFTVVFDVGKTLSKASLWSPDGQLVSRRARPNDTVAGPGYRALDVAGIDRFLIESLAEFARAAPVADIVPVAHGAAAAVISGGRLSLPPMDYEQPITPEVRAALDVDRDAFAETGSPALPDGLNLSAQLQFIETLHPDALAPGCTLLTWAQYWAWRLSGVAACEVTSLGCHTDLWRPASPRPPGWRSFVAGPIDWRPFAGRVKNLARSVPAVATATGLSPKVRVHCGLHDSNAALLAARGYPQFADGEFTVLSTGTWFVAMRAAAVQISPGVLPAQRDCLMNVDVAGRPVPSGRFMGGREIETLTGIDTRRIDIVPDQPRLLGAVPAALQSGARVLPTFAAGCGPFPHARGRWTRMPADEATRRAAVGLYAALVSDVVLELVGTREQVLVEGRFGAAQVLVRALATLCPNLAVYTANSDNDVATGALRLLDPAFRPADPLARVEPLPVDLAGLRREWRAEAQQMEEAA